MLGLDGNVLLDQLTKTKIAIAVGMAKNTIYTNVNSGRRIWVEQVWAGSRLYVNTVGDKCVDMGDKSVKV